MIQKKRKKKRKILNEIEKKEFAQQIINGKMIKQAIAEFDISIVYGYQIFNEMLNWKAEWKTSGIIE